ncbi:hypothetical protein U1Q18_044042 [Sarracenia purpurea var. burkii]
MLSSQFDANSAFNGGGFTFSQSTQATDHGSSPAKNRETNGLVPVTVKKISEASHSGDDKSNFVIDGVDVANVTLVGTVSKKAERVTDVAFTKLQGDVTPQSQSMGSTLSIASQDASNGYQKSSANQSCNSSNKVNSTLGVFFPLWTGSLPSVGVLRGNQSSIL